MSEEWTPKAGKWAAVKVIGAATNSPGIIIIARPDEGGDSVIADALHPLSAAGCVSGAPPSAEEVDRAFSKYLDHKGTFRESMRATLTDFIAVRASAAIPVPRPEPGVGIVKGATVRCVDATGMPLTVGREYTVERLDAGGWPCVTDDDGIRVSYRPTRFVLVQPPAAPVPPAEPLTERERAVMAAVVKWNFLHRVNRGDQQTTFRAYNDLCRALDALAGAPASEPVVPPVDPLTAQERAVVDAVVKWHPYRGGFPSANSVAALHEISRAAEALLASRAPADLVEELRAAAEAVIANDTDDDGLRPGEIKARHTRIQRLRAAVAALADLAALAKEDAK